MHKPIDIVRKQGAKKLCLDHGHSNACLFVFSNRYNIKRKNFATYAKRKGKLYAVNASARSDQYNDAKTETLQQIVGSFRVR